MSQYDAFLVSLCKRDQDMDAEGFDKKAVTAIADQIILFHQARILKSVYEQSTIDNQSDIPTFKKTARDFIAFSGFTFNADNFLQTALQSITPIAQHPLSRRTDSDTVKKTYREYCAFQKMKTLFLYAAYTFRTRKLSVTDTNAANDPYLAFLIDGGLPTSRTEFIYLYSKLLKNPLMLHIHSTLWEDWDLSEPPSSIDSSGISGGFMSDRTREFFCWYNLHKCERSSSLDEKQISQLFSLPFRRQAKELAQQFQKLIDDSNKNPLTEQQKDAAKNTVEFLHSLSKSHEAERHKRIVESDLSEKREEVKGVFRRAYRTNNEHFLEALQSLHIAAPNSKLLRNAGESVSRNIRKLHEKIRYIKPIGDGAGYEGPQHEYTRYAHAYIHEKIALIWEQWKEGTPHMPHARFFEALSILNDNDYIVICNNINSRAIEYRWDEFFPEQQFPYRFVASPSLQEADNNNDAAFYEQIATIEFRHNDTIRKIPVTCFADRDGLSPLTVIFIILPKSPMGMFQHYSFEQPKNEILSVNDHALRFKITDLGRDEELRQRILKNPPNFISQGTTESGSLTLEKRLKEYVHLSITDAFEFTYSAPDDASLCGYIECDFRSAR